LSLPFADGGGRRILAKAGLAVRASREAVMGAVVFWILVAAVVIASMVASVVSKRRRGKRIEEMLSTPGAADVGLGGAAGGDRPVSPNNFGPAMREVKYWRS
jgi:hypothetical protein